MVAAESEPEPRSSPPRPTAMPSRTPARGAAAEHVLAREREKTAQLRQRASRFVTAATNKRREQKKAENAPAPPSCEATGRKQQREAFTERAARVAASYNGTLGEAVVEVEVDSDLAPLQGQPIRQLSVAVRSRPGERPVVLGSVRVGFDARGLCDLPRLTSCTIARKRGSDIALRFSAPSILERALRLREGGYH